MYRHILIPTDGSELAGRAVRHGLALTKSAGAKVTALTVDPSFDVYTVPASRVYEMSGAFAEHAERAKAHARGILDGVAEEARAAGDVCETVQVEQDHPYQGIIDTAEQRGCDLIVMTSHGRSGIAARLPPRRVAVAWKDVREARRAVQEALPFLREAENVMIVEVSERGGDQASSRLRDVANYLARHGVATVTERVLPVDATAANSLRFIADENISLLAAGGDGHSRLGEWAYGGVTRDLLAESPVCCLFSH